MPKTLSAVGGPRRSSALGNPILRGPSFSFSPSIVGIDRLYEFFPLTPASNSAPRASFSELLVAGIRKVAFDFSEGIGF